MRKQQFVARAFALVATLTVGAAYAVGPEGPPPGKGPHGHDRDKDHDGDKDRDKDRHRERGEDHDKGPELGRGPGHHGMRELIEELKSGKLKKADLKARLGKLHDQRDERMKQHREELKARFGATLAAPGAREELEQHARRMAKLDRAMVLCETDVTKDKDKLKDRIQKLVDKENERHERALERLKSMPPTPPGPATSAAPAAPPAASAAVKAGDK